MTTNVADAKSDRRDLGAFAPEVVNMSAEPNEPWKHHGHNKHGHGPNCHHSHGHSHGHGNGHGHHHHGKCKTKTVVVWAPCTSPDKPTVQPTTNPTTNNPDPVTTNPPITSNTGLPTGATTGVPTGTTTTTSKVSTGAGSSTTVKTGTATGSATGSGTGTETGTSPAATTSTTTGASSAATTGSPTGTSPAATPTCTAESGHIVDRTTGLCVGVDTLADQQAVLEKNCTSATAYMNWRLSDGRMKSDDSQFCLGSHPDTSGGPLAFSRMTVM
ncbi:hypothetical protein BGZ68_002605, partial [Mortierella alpina]